MLCINNLLTYLLTFCFQLFDSVSVSVSNEFIQHNSIAASLIALNRLVITSIWIVTKLPQMKKQIGDKRCVYAGGESERVGATDVRYSQVA